MVTGEANYYRRGFMSKISMITKSAVRPLAILALGVGVLAPFALSASPASASSAPSYTATASDGFVITSTSSQQGVNIGAAEFSMVLAKGGVWTATASSSCSLFTSRVSQADANAQANASTAPAATSTIFTATSVNGTFCSTYSQADATALAAYTPHALITGSVVFTAPDRNSCSQVGRLPSRDATSWTGGAARNCKWSPAPAVKKK
jgi:hypothetical protein